MEKKEFKKLIKEELQKYIKENNYFDKRAYAAAKQDQDAEENGSEIDPEFGGVNFKYAKRGAYNPTDTSAGDSLQHPTSDQDFAVGDKLKKLRKIWSDLKTELAGNIDFRKEFITEFSSIFEAATSREQKILAIVTAAADKTNLSKEKRAGKQKSDYQKFVDRLTKAYEGDTDEEIDSEYKELKVPSLASEEPVQTISDTKSIMNPSVGKINLKQDDDLITVSVPGTTAELPRRKLNRGYNLEDINNWAEFLANTTAA